MMPSQYVQKTYARVPLPDNVPTILTYADALQRYEISKVFKTGKNKGFKPLGNRRYGSRSKIVKEFDNVHIRHWITNVLTYHPDGSLTFRVSQHQSPSTAYMLQKLIGVEFVQRFHRKIYYVDSTNRYYHIGESLHVPKLGDAPTEILDHNREFAWHLIREQMSATRKRYTPMLEYAKQIHALTIEHSAPRGITKPALTIDARNLAWRDTRSYEEVERSHFFNVLYLAMNVADEQERLDALYPLVQRISVNAGQHTVNHFSTDTQHGWLCRFDQFNQYFTELMKYQFNKTIFERKEVTTGKPSKDKNAKYVNYGTR